MLKRQVKTLAQRMLRIPRTRGFGVQSPTAYTILRTVLNEKGFLKVHNALLVSQSLSYPFSASRQERLLFRLRFYNRDMHVSSARNLVTTGAYESLFASLSVRSVLVVEGINEGDDERNVWSRILADSRSVLSFDLLNCGVVFFDKTKIKQNFKVNY